MNTGEKVLEMAEKNPELAKALGIEQPKQEQAQSGKALKVVRMSDIEAEAVSWLWEPYIPKGKLTLLEGDPGRGKTWVALALAAAVSTGAPMPDDQGRMIHKREPVNVIYLSAEDGLADTLRPRLDAVGADVNKVYAVTGTIEDKKEGIFSFDDLILLDGLAAVLSPALIVIDPIQAYLGASIDMHRANETRPVLARLGALAERHRCAVVCIRHLSKATATKGIYRGMGSIDFTAAARSVLLAGSDPQDDSRRAIVHLKSSLAPAGATQGYELRDGFYWTGLSPLTASDILGSEQIKKQENKLADAETWLEEILADGPMLKTEVEEQAKNEEISPKTLRRAREKMGVLSYKKPGEKNGPYLWELPRKEMEDNDLPKMGSPSKPLGQTTGKPSTRKNPSNDAASTGCPGKNNGQDVEPYSSKGYSDSHGLPRKYPRDGQAENSIDGQAEGVNTNTNNGKEWVLDWNDI